MVLKFHMMDDHMNNITNMIPNEVVRLWLWLALKSFEMLHVINILSLSQSNSSFNVIFLNFTVHQLNPVVNTFITKENS